MRIIDFRLRPPLKAFLSMVMYANVERSGRMSRDLGMFLAPSASQKSMDLLLKEMDQAGIEIGVVPGRISPVLGSIDNDQLADVITAYPDRLAGFAAIDPTERKSATAAIDDALTKGMKGIVLEPGLLRPARYLDDANLYPLYAHCEDRGIPILFMAGGNAGPDPTYSSPEHIDRVARDFPSLKIVSGHGNWPWVSEILHVCYRRTNIYLSPDMYLYGNMPGSTDYINAANGFMANRFLFATAYPLLPVTEVVKTFLSFPLKEEVLERIMYKNAVELLNIGNP